MRWILLLFGGIVVLLACAILILAIPLPRPLPEPFSKGRNLVGAITVGGLGLLYVGGLTAYLVTGVLNSGRGLDPALTSAGFSAQGYMLIGREYRGTVRDRPAMVRYTPPQRGRAAVIDITVAASLDLRLAAGTRRPLLDCRDCALVAADDVGLAGLQFYAMDEMAARQLLADVAVQDVFSHLLLDTQAMGTTEVYIQAEQIWLRAHLQPVSGELLLAWLDDLAALAEAVE